MIIPGDTSLCIPKNLWILYDGKQNFRYLLVPTVMISVANGGVFEMPI